MVVEEADERVYRLELIQASATCSGVEVETLLRESRELSAIFSQSQITAKANARNART